MFPIVHRFGTGYVTMDQMGQHYADPGKFNGSFRCAFRSGWLT